MWWSAVIWVLDTLVLGPEKATRTPPFLEIKSSLAMQSTTSAEIVDSLAFPPRVLFLHLSLEPSHYLLGRQLSYFGHDFGAEVFPDIGMQGNHKPSSAPIRLKGNPP
jgi:hypothetical protein